MNKSHKYISRAKSLVFLIIISLSTVTYSEQISSHSIYQVAKNYGSWRKNTNYRKVLRNIPDVAGKKTGNIVAHQTQALILIYILSCVDIVKQHIEYSNLKKSEINENDLFKQFGEAAKIVIGSGEIWGGLIGGGLTSTAGSKPLKILNEISENNISSPIFKSLVQTGAATLVTFLGWEFGAQLYRESIELIENDQDYERAKNLGQVFWSFVNTSFSDNNQNKDDTRIIKLIFKNMWTILWYDHDLRNFWIYNAWRFKIAKGEFVTLVSSMVGATALGTKIYPGAGTIAGLAFGVAGGLLTIIIPKKYKDKISDKIKYFRYGFWRIGHDTRNSGFKVRKNIIEIVSKSLRNGSSIPPKLKYPSNTSAENDMMTVLFEKLYHYQTSLQIIQGQYDLAKSSENNQAQNKLSIIKKKYQTKLDNIINQVTSFYQNEYEYLQSSIDYYNLNQFIEPGENDHLEIIDKIYSDRNNSKLLSEFMVELKRNSKASQQLSYQHYLQVLHQFYIFGFKKRELLTLLNKNNF